jgi:DNA-binding MarR family transcriptional regulator
MKGRFKATPRDAWGQSTVFLDGVPVRRVPVSLSRRFFQICMAVAAEVAAEKDLTTLEFGALTYLYDEADIDQSGLTSRLGIDRSNTSIIVDQLEEKGLVERRVNGADRRARLLRLTPAGRRIRDGLRPKAGAAQARILAVLSPSEREGFLDMLVRIIEANEAYARPGASRRKPRRRTPATDSPKRNRRATLERLSSSIGGSR